MKIVQTANEKRIHLYCI